MLKLAALAALGYAGYRFYKREDQKASVASARQTAVAGGPLSDQARLQHSADAPAQ